MVERGEITADDARRLVDEMVRRAQVGDGQRPDSANVTVVDVDAQEAQTPRPIEITAVRTMWVICVASRQTPR